jgi:hypothetical protein
VATLHLTKFRRVVRVETPIGLMLDIERSI